MLSTKLLFSCQLQMHNTRFHRKNSHNCWLTWLVGHRANLWSRDRLDYRINRTTRFHKTSSAPNQSERTAFSKIQWSNLQLINQYKPSNVNRRKCAKINLPLKFKSSQTSRRTLRVDLRCYSVTPASTLLSIRQHPNRYIRWNVSVLITSRGQKIASITPETKSAVLIGETNKEQNF